MKKIIIGIIALALIGAGLYFTKKKNGKIAMQEVKPETGSIAVEFRETGTVSPRNRLEIRPPIYGRMDDVLVVEGQNIKKGQTLAWMSSTDRAALLDAARSKGAEELKKWQDTYNPTPIIAPLDGFIISRRKEPGQTVDTGDVILVMADTLIIESTMDETDLRYIHLGQNVDIVLDAYPDEKFKGVVEHIAYESEVINNVTVYRVKIKPLSTPKVFRAGMTATIDVEANRKDNALLIPQEAVIEKENDKFVLVRSSGPKPERKRIETGIVNTKHVEIISGITADDIVLIPGKTRNKDRQQTRMGGIPGMGAGGRR